jgi:hypothetical protein
MSKQTAEIILEWLKSQKKIEQAKYIVIGQKRDPVLYALSQASNNVMHEIDRQIKELENFITP